MNDEVTEFYKAKGLNLAEDKNLCGYLVAQSEDVLIGALVLCERETRKQCPNAKLIKIGDKHGVVTHIGVYDLPLTLTNRHTFLAAKQYAPQLLSTELIPYNETHLTETLKLALQMAAWGLSFAQCATTESSKLERTQSWDV